MPSKWKSNKNLKPQVILDKIDSTKTVSGSDAVSFTGFLYENALIALKTMIEYPDQIPDTIRENLLSQAINNVARKLSLNSTNVLIELNNLIKIELQKKEQKYFLLTSISIGSSIPIKSIKIKNCNIRFFKDRFPKKYSSRDPLKIDYKNEYKFDHKGYSNVIVSVMKKSAISAASECLDTIDLLRGVWCLLSNSTLQLMGEEWIPINAIRLGQVHTIHNSNGTVASPIFWYEPNYIFCKPLKIENHKIFKKNTYYIFNKLKKCKYSKILINSIIRYARALDERDQNTAAIRLWSALENIASPNFQTYNQLTNRCSFIFDEFEYHKQILEHLREYRNQNIHSGDHYEKAKTICFQLQYYFYHLILFHLKNVDVFNSLEEANHFLDLPRDKKQIERKVHILNSAIDFLS